MSITCSVLHGTARNRINGNMNIMGMTFSQCFKHPTVQSPKFQFHSHIQLLPTVLTEKSCVKWSGCCISMFAKAWPDRCCGPEEWAKTNRWVERRKRCCSVCPEHHASRCPSSETDHLALHPLGWCQERRRKRQIFGESDERRPQVSDKSYNLMSDLSNPPYLQTYAHWHTFSFKQASDFAQQQLNDIMMHPLRYSLFGMRHSCSTYHSSLLAKFCRSMLSQGHAALSACGWK